LVHLNVINVPVIFTVHVFLFGRCIHDVLFSITLTGVCTCAYNLYKFLIKLLIFPTVFLIVNLIISLFAPVLTAVGNFPLSMAQ